MSEPRVIHSSTLPPVQPVYILRGHPSPIHTLLFIRNNTRLLSGDADGWAVLWAIVTKRPVAVWKAHDTTVLGATTWGDKKIITHGRDGKICVWSLSTEDEAGLSTELPLHGEGSTHRRQPWLLHTLEVPGMNFCTFTSCKAPHEISPPSSVETDETSPASHPDEALLIAVAGAAESEIEMYRLPDEKKVGAIPQPDQTMGKTGMVMALRMLRTPNGDVVVVAGYESGRTYVYKQITQANSWEVRYTARPHLQPILSLDVQVSLNAFYTSSADAVIAKHPLSLLVKHDTTIKETQTKHAGQQGLHLRSDGKILATAGWDSRVRVYSAKTLKELAVLKWHKEGCFATAFASVDDTIDDVSKPVGILETQVTRHDTRMIHRPSVEQSRHAKAQSTHWLAGGSKDGKISLWDIY